MSCCGGKRKEWLKQEKPVNSLSNNENVPVTAVKEKRDRIFEYTGNGTLQIKGSITGKLYSFKYHGEKLNVSRVDSWALMAEKDLRLAR